MQFNLVRLNTAKAIVALVLSIVCSSLLMFPLVGYADLSRSTAGIISTTACLVFIFFGFRFSTLNLFVTVEPDSIQINDDRFSNEDVQGIYSGVKGRRIHTTVIRLKNGKNVQVGSYVNNEMYSDYLELVNVLEQKFSRLD